MSRGFFFKIGTIFLLVLLLMIPLMQINGLIAERQHRRDDVVQDIARSSSGSQTLTGPLLVIPYHKTVRTWREDVNTKQRIAEEHQVDGELYFLPETFNMNGQVQTEVRKRGIYAARLYHANSEITGHFLIPRKLGITDDYDAYRFDPAYLSLGISDIRGIEDALELRVNDKVLKVDPGTRTKMLGTGVHAMVPDLDGITATTFTYQLQLKLQGTSDLQVTPVGRASKIVLASNWPNPSFVGEYLPVTRNVDKHGFKATWTTTFFSTNMVEALDDCAGDGNCSEFNGRHFGVSLIDPVDQYLKSNRAIKYALLFVVLTFAGFFLFEVLKQLAVHPIQYGLVGLALALFYLLLLSMSEYMAFGVAYAISATACVGLIGFYVTFVLHSFFRGAGFAICLAALYAMLYELLSAEDYSLLMGSILVFGLLAVVMVLTRNVNWFNVTGRPAG